MIVHRSLHGKALLARARWRIVCHSSGALPSEDPSRRPCRGGFMRAQQHPHQLEGGQARSDVGAAPRGRGPSRAPSLQTQPALQSPVAHRVLAFMGRPSLCSPYPDPAAMPAIDQAWHTLQGRHTSKKRRRWPPTMRRTAHERAVAPPQCTQRLRSIAVAAERMLADSDGRRTI